MKWWMMQLGWIRHRCHGGWRSLVVHLGRVVVHAQAQTNVMSIVVCLWWYVIMTTV
jgi:hypothetical protein